MTASMADESCQYTCSQRQHGNEPDHPLNESVYDNGLNLRPPRFFIGSGILTQFVGILAENSHCFADLPQSFGLEILSSLILFITQQPNITNSFEGMLVMFGPSPWRHRT